METARRWLGLDKDQDVGGQPWLVALCLIAVMAVTTLVDRVWWQELAIATGICLAIGVAAGFALSLKSEASH